MDPADEGRREGRRARDLDRKEASGRSRRGLLAAGAGVAGLAATEMIARAAPAQASNGKPVLLGVLNTASATTEIEAQSSSGSAAAILAAPQSGIGVSGAGDVVGVNGVAIPGTNGDGVHGLADGHGTGVKGSAGSPVIGQGVGVTAEHTSGGTALRVIGSAVFSRSGTLTIKAGHSAITQTGVALTAASLIFVTLQNHVPGVYVQSAVPDALKGSFTVHLSSAAPVATTVAWFIVN